MASVKKATKKYWSFEFNVIFTAHLISHIKNSFFNLVWNNRLPIIKGKKCLNFTDFWEKLGKYNRLPGKKQNNSSGFSSVCFMISGQAYLNLFPARFKSYGNNFCRNFSKYCTKMHQHTCVSVVVVKKLAIYRRRAKVRTETLFIWNWKASKW